MTPGESMPRKVKQWPDEDILRQGIVAADAEYSVPFAVHVFVFNDVQSLRAACGDPLASAYSTTYDKPDESGVGAVVMLAQSELHMSLVAHEVTHVALHHHGNVIASREGARRWLFAHPESVAEMVGNLTALIWHQICQDTRSS